MQNVMIGKNIFLMFVIFVLEVLFKMVLKFDWWCLRFRYSEKTDEEKAKEGEAPKENPVAEPIEADKEEEK